jgi:hypothetical protein
MEQQNLASEIFSVENIGQYPITSKWYKKEKIMKRKSKNWRRLDVEYRNSLKSVGCARTMDITIKSGVENWFEWCNCKKNCSHKWSYEWLLLTYITKNFLANVKFVKFKLNGLREV